MDDVDVVYSNFDLSYPGLWEAIKRWRWTRTIATKNGMRRKIERERENNKNMKGCVAGLFLVVGCVNWGQPSTSIANG